MEDFIQLEPHYFWEVRNGGPPLFGTLGPIGATARGYWGASPCGWLTRHDSELNVTTLLLAATLHYSLHFSHLFSFKRRQRRFC
jgi:hypothetical protein